MERDFYDLKGQGTLKCQKVNEVLKFAKSLKLLVLHLLNFVISQD